MAVLVRERCEICGGETEPAGERRGFRLRRCPACGFAFVERPRTDYDALYGEDYYAGRGADPLVDYAFELAEPERTVRLYEWRGIRRAVAALLPVGPATRWLDYGCGTGGLVRHLRETVGCDALGYEQGWAAGRLAVPHLDDDAFAAATGTFDVVTAIEVIEHAIEPVALLRRLRELLRPGGLLFLTTGNASGRDLERWRYVVPEIHVSFFEPRTLERALREAGLRPERRGRLPGHTEILRFKILKNLGVRRRSPLEAALPWPLLARLADAREGVTAHPVGWAHEA
jgi:SAM-dependent methyltransferase